MASVVNRVNPTIYRLSVSTPDYNPVEWIINPPGLDTLLVANVPSKYWKISGEDVVEMLQAEKDVVDSDEAVAAVTQEKDSAVARLRDDPDIRKAFKALLYVMVLELDAIKDGTPRPKQTVGQLGLEAIQAIENGDV